MKTVLQRVSWAEVEVEGRIVARIEQGFLLLVGVHQEDTERQAEAMAQKVAQLRVFNDTEGKMNLPLEQVQGSVLAVSNFTVYGDARKGRRPSFVEAASYQEGEHLFNYFCERLASLGVPVQKGVYGAHMKVRLENDGPVTLILDV